MNENTRDFVFVVVGLAVFAALVHMVSSRWGPPSPSKEFLSKNEQLAADNNTKLIWMFGILTATWPLMLAYYGWKNRKDVLPASKEWLSSCGSALRVLILLLWKPVCILVFLFSGYVPLMILGFLWALHVWFLTPILKAMARRTANERPERED